ncbi:hypothetical protein TREMEDRAFT_64789 [Tremella mesenterica DSM 1558]|uniref:uncharacterized protein n=1 Tax=Tremella mesenterica (strain ATCC 24925 / CBS 8224 / DSM 1558 / NBRC 9311 / NRRL Y-6157 / RJB 2259-6 / UBC 559-6) TaxID=578456 RepID=UPI0003F4A3B5|nr:uncharacterized protein TREMEDRAFT_64789 [Tremella mesenterica DSM 1558]EIW66934.1 hypothetical protein TREMEDRAFT_64789 [Tremella mesenterica DSM 1558]
MSAKLDFGSISGISSKASMKRKSLLQALGKNQSRNSSIAPPLPTPLPSSSSHHPLNSQHAEEHSLYSPDSPYAESSSSHTRDHQRERSTSVSYLSGGRVTSSTAFKKDGKDDGKGSIRRPEDMFRVVKERMFGWSYLMEWYQGDIHWFNAVKISHSTLEQSIGPGKMDQRARHMFVLGASLAALFDIIAVDDLLKGLLKTMEEWEQWSEGGSKGVKSIFRGQKSGKRSGGMGEMGSGDHESFLLPINLPFTPDFFQVHSSCCSIIRDVYKKILNQILPCPPPPYAPPPPDPFSLFHPSTYIHSAPVHSHSHPHQHSRAHETTPPNMNPKSPGGFSTVTAVTTPGGSWDPSTIRGGGNFDSETPGSGPRRGVGTGIGIGTVQYDAFQMLVMGELGEDRMLIGDGQKLTSVVIDLFSKVDTKLKKLFSTLLREGDTLAKKIVEEELSLLCGSLAGGPAMKFDLSTAVSGSGNGYLGPPLSRSIGQSSGYGTIRNGMDVWTEEVS